MRALWHRLRKSIDTKGASSGMTHHPVGTSTPALSPIPSWKHANKGPQNGAKEYLGREESVNFPDVLPVQISSYASIEELNSRLKNKGQAESPIERFRPKIVTKGDGAWTEDNWKTVKINGSTLEAIMIDVVARCGRCQVPNVDCVSVSSLLSF